MRCMKRVLLFSALGALLSGADALAQGTDFWFPVNGWSNAWFDMADASGTSGTVTVTIYDEDGVQQRSRSATIPANGYLNTRDISGIGNIYDWAQPASVHITSTQSIVVSNGRWSPSAGWGMTVPPTTEAAGTDFRFPLKGWEDSWVEMANTTGSTANIVITIYNKAGTAIISSHLATLPPRGYLRTWDILPLHDIYQYAKPAVIHITSDRALVVANGRWRSSVGWGFVVLPTSVAAGTDFRFPVMGWSNAWMEMANTTTLVATITVYVYAENGALRGTYFSSVPGNGYLYTRDVSGLGEIYDRAKPASVRITSTLPVVVANGRWSTSSGWGMTVPPVSAVLGTDFRFPLKGWDNTWVEMANTSGTQTANVTVAVYNQNGQQVTGSPWTDTISANGYLRTWDITGLGDIYNKARPAVVHLTSTQPVVVANGRWSSSVGWGFYVPPN